MKRTFLLCVFLLINVILYGQNQSIEINGYTVYYVAANETGDGTTVLNNAYISIPAIDRAIRFNFSEVVIDNRDVLVSSIPSSNQLAFTSINNHPVEIDSYTLASGEGFDAAMTAFGTVQFEAGDFAGALEFEDEPFSILPDGQVVFEYDYEGDPVKWKGWPLEPQTIQNGPLLTDVEIRLSDNSVLSFDEVKFSDDGSIVNTGAVFDSENMDYYDWNIELYQYELVPKGILASGFVSLPNLPDYGFSVNEMLLVSDGTVESLEFTQPIDDYTVFFNTIEISLEGVDFSDRFFTIRKITLTLNESLTKDPIVLQNATLDAEGILEFEEPIEAEIDNKLFTLRQLELTSNGLVLVGPFSDTETGQQFPVSDTVLSYSGGMEYEGTNAGVAADEKAATDTTSGPDETSEIQSPAGSEEGAEVAESERDGETDDTNGTLSQGAPGDEASTGDQPRGTSDNGSVSGRQPGDLAGGDLLQSVKQGNASTVRNLLESGASPDSVDRKGIPVVMHAIKARNVEVLKVLLANGASVDYTTEGGYTPLMLAARRGDYEITRLLLEAGADPNAVDEYGRTPLMHVLVFDWDLIAVMLLDYGADPSIENEFAKTARDYANPEKAERFLARIGK